MSGSKCPLSKWLDRSEELLSQEVVRIMAIITVMAMALLVYALAEECLLEALAALKRRTARRLRWIFQLQENIHW